MAKESILIIEDEKDILELVAYNLGKEGYDVRTASTGEDGLDTARSRLPNLIILDLLLPGIEGLEVCRILKHDPKTQHIPIVILTAKGEDADVVTGLELGAEDYITKPFSPRVLLARIRAVLRRKSTKAMDETATIRIHEIVIHPGRHEVLAGSAPISLTPTEFSILHFLARHPGWVFTRYQIVDGIRGDEAAVTDRSVDVQIVGLRKKLGELGNYIETVRGVGYRFRE